jgi:hypothetical protein
MLYANRMKSISMKIILLLAVLAGGVSASDLPDCPTDENASWNNCFGTYTDSKGNKYAGEWKDGNSSGQGTLTFSDGAKYVGDFKDHKANGKGITTWPGGNIYVGEWKDDKRNGQGTYTSKDRTIREGIWKDDEFLGTVAEVERAERVRIAAEEKAERIYNACLLDKGADVDMSVSSLESALKATCRSIAEDPSFLEGLRYD